MSSQCVESKVTYWQSHIDNCDHSNLSGAAYCQAQGLVYHQFTYWRRKLSQVEPPSAVASLGFSRVVLQPESSSTGLHLRLPGGVEVHGIDGSNVVVVHQLLSGL